MSQRDYQAIANIIREALERDHDYERFVIVKIATELAAFIKETYPRFNRDKFYRACGLDHLAAN